MGYKPEYPMTGLDSSGLKSTIEWIANWVLNFQEDEMDLLRKRMYPSRYPDEPTNKDDIQVSV